MMRSDNLQLACGQPPSSSYDFQLAYKHRPSNYLTNNTQVSRKFSENPWAAMTCVLRTNEQPFFSSKGTGFHCPSLQLSSNGQDFAHATKWRWPAGSDTQGDLDFINNLIFLDNLWQSYRQDRQNWHLNLTFQVTCESFCNSCDVFVLIPFLCASLCLLKIMQVDFHFPE